MISGKTSVHDIPKYLDEDKVLYKEDINRIVNDIDSKLSGGGGGGTVNSVNGKQGNVVLKGNDIKVSDTDDTTIDVALSQKLTSDDVINDVTSDYTNKPLSAKMGKLLQESKIEKTDIIDNLTTTSPSRPLSANQGKVLNDTKVNIIDIVNDLSSEEIYKPLSAKQGYVLKNDLTNHSEDKDNPHETEISNLKDVNLTTLQDGDILKYDVTTNKFKNVQGGGGAVESVNGKNGVVVLKGNDIEVNAGNTDKLDVALDKKCNKDDGVLTGTTNAENIVISGDLTCDGDTSLANVVVSGEIDIPTPTADNQASTKKYVDDRKEELLTLINSIINDTIKSASSTYSSNKIQELLDALSGKATIIVVETLPATLQDNTLYYVGTESPYHIYLRSNSVTYDMGTTNIDLTGYLKTTGGTMTGNLVFNGCRIESNVEGIIYKNTETQRQISDSTRVLRIDKIGATTFGFIIDFENEKLNCFGNKVIDQRDIKSEETTTPKNYEIYNAKYINDNMFSNDNVLSAKKDTPEDKEVYNAKYINDNVATLQAVYDMIYPLNYLHIGFQAPATPTGISATWTEQTTYNGRYLKIDSTKTAGTSEAEQLPNVKGNIMGVSDNAYYTSGIQTAPFKSSTNKYSKPNVSLAGSNYDIPSIQMDLSTYNSSLYKDGGNVKPLTTTIKVWKRTA